LKDILIKFKQHPKYDTVVSWGKLISITGSTQIVVQAVGFLCGILVIRLLPTQEYALYTIANTMMGTMTMLADSGISAGVMAQGGKVWQDREKLGAVLATGLDLRRKFAIGSLIVSTPILLYLLLHNDASWLMATLIVLSMIPAFYAALSDSLLEIAPKLHQSILPLQKNQVTVGVGRLLLSAVTLFIFPWTFVAILAGGIPRIYGNIQLQKIANNFVDKSQRADKEVKKAILKSVKKILPNAIYLTFSGQITIWLLSLFGTSTNLAQIGALGRISIILSLFGAVFGQLFVPRFVRLKHDKKLLFTRYLQINLVGILASGLTLLGVWLFSSQILWVLGSKYSHLHTELFLCMIGGTISLFHGISFVLCAQRGWMISPFIAIGTDFIAIIIGILLFNVSSLKDMLWFNIFIASVLLVQNVAFAIYKINTTEQTQ
jgi:O-antigen/teichoic acid export membrane protein